jgi:Leucine-rich repeat (LRR) protein
MKKLRNLSLWKAGLRKLPASLHDLDCLQQLDLSYNSLTQLPKLSGLPALGYLGLCGLRDLDWQRGFDRLAELAPIKNINKTLVDATVWQECRDSHPHLTIWGTWRPLEEPSPRTESSTVLPEEKTGDANGNRTATCPFVGQFRNQPTESDVR